MGPRTFLTMIFTRNIPKTSGSVYSSIFLLQTIYHNFTWGGQNSQKMWILLQFSSGPPGNHIWNEIYNFLRIRST